jgi:Protein of unknown function (DUF2721)
MDAGSIAAPAPVAVIAAMVTPALLILASSSLIATVLARLGRVVDRTRALAAIALEGKVEASGMMPAELRAALQRYAARARYAELSIRLLYAAVVVFVVTCLSIVAEELTRDALRWLPVGLAIAGMLLLLAGGALMVVESRLGGRHIAEEIGGALARLDEKR